MEYNVLNMSLYTSQLIYSSRVNLMGKKKLEKRKFCKLQSNSNLFLKEQSKWYFSFFFTSRDEPHRKEDSNKEKMVKFHGPATLAVINESKKN